MLISLIVPTDTYAGQNVVATFNFLQLLGLALQLAVLVPALFSARIHRMRTWYIMIIAGMVYNFCYIPLMILGEQLGPAPSFGLCLFQSNLIYGAPVLYVLACKVFHIAEGFARLVSFSLAFVVEVSFSFYKRSPEWFNTVLGLPCFEECNS